MKELLRERQCTKILVLDTTALLSSFQLLIHDCLITTSEVYDEVRDNENYEKMLLSLNLNRLIIVETPEIKIDIPNRLREKLSKTDISTLKLSYYLKNMGYDVCLVTDDYALEKAASHLKINFMPIKTMGINKLSNFKQENSDI